FLVFFFQAEDGIRDRNVTGVQTCALPIWGGISSVSAMNTTPSPGPEDFPQRSLDRPADRSAGLPPGRSSQQWRQPPVVWQAVLGLGALVLLWPLTSLTGVAAAIGPAPRALAVIAVIGATWIGVVGLGRLPRPILTLTLTGMAAGAYLVLADLVTGAGVSGGLSFVAVPFLILDLIGGGAAGGVLAGLCAAGVQRLQRQR